MLPYISSLLSDDKWITPIAITKDFNPQFSFSQELQQILYGKKLLMDEIPFSSKEIDEHFEHGYVGFIPGLTEKTLSSKKQFQCSRCGTSRKHHFYSFPCARCGKQCVYCRNCIMMGKITLCSKLYVWTGPPLHHKPQQNPLSWDGKLSEGQQSASQAVLDVVHSKKTLLVWAVCGAGKTEVLFQGMDQALQNGKTVCIATPRTDVVLELAPRIKKAFPHTAIAALYGGSEEKHLPAQLVITTTHQLLRFYQAFDVIIIDEVDAFPFSSDTSLQFAVEKAKKPHSAIIYLTATPSQKIQHQARKGIIECVKIPARYHRHPIPVPILKWTGNWKKSLATGKIPKPIFHWIQTRLQNKTPFLLFFGNIEQMEKYLPLFQKLYPELLSVHAEDPKRKEKVQALRMGKVLGLLTTTILERGVTIPKLDVAVIGAEEDIFTESALVQIAGRVGRSAAHPTGDVTFFHYGKTEAMLEAISHIKSMNLEAKKRGLIDV